MTKGFLRYRKNWKKDFYGTGKIETYILRYRKKSKSDFSKKSIRGWDHERPHVTQSQLRLGNVTWSLLFLEGVGDLKVNWFPRVTMQVFIMDQ